MSDNPNPKINSWFLKKNSEWEDQLQIHIEDYFVDGLNVNLNKRSTSDQINCGFLLKIIVWKG